MNNEETIESVTVPETILLKFLARGDRDAREGNLLSDDEADRHFRDKLAALKPKG